jgi:hypothetical protein
MSFGSKVFGPLVLLGAATACGGTIEFGVDRGDSGVVAPVPDSGATPRPDASVAPQPDAGACTPRTRPPIPTTWPYPVSAASYRNNFYNVVPNLAGCSPAGCHGGATDPYIPPAANIDAEYARAITALWPRALPPVGGTASLRLKHAPEGGAQSPPYTAAQITAIEQFLSRAYDCAWKGAPAPGAGECPAPDVSYCDL